MSYSSLGNIRQRPGVVQLMAGVVGEIEVVRPFLLWTYLHGVHALHLDPTAVHDSGGVNREDYLHHEHPEVALSRPSGDKRLCKSCYANEMHRLGRWKSLEPNLVIVDPVVAKDRIWKSVMLALLIDRTRQELPQNML